MSIKAMIKEFNRGDIDDIGIDIIQKRFVLVDTDTGEIVDDAQGYGYESAHKAHKAYGWKKTHRRPGKGR